MNNSLNDSNHPMSPIRPKKIKISIGQSRLQTSSTSGIVTTTAITSSSSSSSSSSSNQVLNETIESTQDFGERGNISLASICQKRYGNKFRKRKSDDENKGDHESKESNRRLSQSTQLRIFEPEKPLLKTTGPRVELVDGQIVLKESSLEIGQDSLYADDGNPYEEIEEAGNQSSTTYASFRKRASTASWGIEETFLFYQCLRSCGLNFTLMQTFFPGRTRDGLKKKYQREMKTHPQLVEQSLKKGLPLELEVFSAYFDDDRIKEEADPKNANILMKSDQKEEVE